MDIKAEQVINLVSELAWPITVVILVLLLRKEIHQLIPLITKLKAGPLEAEFEKKVNTAKEGFEPQAADSDTSRYLNRDELVQLAMKSPRTAIIESWKSLESRLRQALIRNGGPMPDVSTSLKIIRALEASDILSERDVSLVSQLRGLAKEALNIIDFSPTEASAFTYIEMAKSLEERVGSKGIQAANA